MSAVLPVRSRNPWSRAVAAIARREREVRDTLWLLLTLAWVVAPHVADLPAWTVAGFGALLLWRTVLTWRGRRLPHRLIPVALTCLAGFAVWFEYRTIFGKDAGVAFVVLLLGLKLLEMRARRDIFVVIFLSLFVMLTSLFESQSMAMAALLLVGLWMLVAALVSAQFARFEPSWSVKARIATRVVAYALPLMAVLFVLFPRVEGPLWGMPTDAYAAKTGLSDTMSPGSFGTLSQSREMAFRVRFIGRAAAPADRYWRGPVFGRFDGRAWSALPERQRRGPSGANLVVDRSSAIDYAMTLEPSNRPWMMTLDVTPDRASDTPVQTRLRADLQVVGDALVRDRVNYVARAYTRYRTGGDETRARLQEWLELPPGFNPRTHALAVRMLADGDRPAGDGDEGPHDRRMIDRVLAMIRTQDFVYTLEPPPLGRDAVDEFLFDTRRGFCEHYAGAFVVLMRALDIPARVVTGYQGGEINPVDGYLEVRQRDAHAWAEVWLPKEGWIRVDPTAAVAPGRIELGAAEGLDRVQGIAGLLGDRSWLGGFLQRARFNLDAVSNAWNQWVLAYNADRQSGIFSGLGIERIDWQALTVLLMGGFAATLAAIGAMTLYRRRRVDPVVALYERACALLARSARRTGAGSGPFERAPAEGPRDYLARIGPALPERQRSAAADVFALYEQLRYARDGGDASLRTRFARAVAALRR